MNTLRITESWYHCFLLGITSNNSKRNIIFFEVLVLRLVSVLVPTGALIFHHEARTLRSSSFISFTAFLFILFKLQVALYLL